MYSFSYGHVILVVKYNIWMNTTNWILKSIGIEYCQIWWKKLLAIHFQYPDCKVLKYWQYLSISQNIIGNNITAIQYCNINNPEYDPEPSLNMVIEDSGTTWSYKRLRCSTDITYRYLFTIRRVTSNLL